MPFGVSSPSSVLIGEKVYVGGGFVPNINKCTVVVYDLSSGKWDKLPRLYKAVYFGMADIRNRLVLIGGKDGQTKKHISELNAWNEITCQWEEIQAPMPTPRCGMSVCTHGKWVVVAGGWREGGEYVNTVEILDTTANHWYAAIPLPHACSYMTSATDGKNWYLLGGFIRKEVTRSVFSVSFPQLIAKAISQCPSSQEQPNAYEVWQCLPNIPLNRSAALMLGGSLLAVGGFDERTKTRSSAIYLYQQDRRDWVNVGDIPSCRIRCSCVSLTKGEFLLVGGYDYDIMNQVDKGTVAYQ